MASRKSAAATEAGAPAAPSVNSARALTPLAADRILPNSLDAEIAVLGAMLVSPSEAAPAACSRLKEDCFYYAAHRVIFRELAAMQDAMHAVDQMTVIQRLRDKGQLEEVGGAVYLAELVHRVPTTAHLEYYVDIVEEKYLLRRIIEAAHEMMGEAFEPQENVREWVDGVEQKLFKITAEQGTQGAVPIREVITGAMASIERLYETRGITGLPTGFRGLDKLTSGLQGGQVFVIAARPAMGKTSLAMNIAEHVAVDQRKPVVVFSLEMSAEELVKRMLFCRARTSLNALRDGFLSQNRQHDLTHTASELMKAPLFIDDRAGLTINQVRAQARRLKQQHKIELVVIDYLQLMRAPSRRGDASRQVEVADISGGVKAMAKELSVPVIVLSQLNRQPDQRDDGKPKLSDLRESGAIEQDADIVGLLVRPEKYADSPEEEAEKKGKAELIIAKQRNGPTGKVHLTFLEECTRFEDGAIEDDDVPQG